MSEEIVRDSKPGERTKATFVAAESCSQTTSSATSRKDALKTPFAKPISGWTEGAVRSACEPAPAAATQVVSPPNIHNKNKSLNFITKSLNFIVPPGYGCGNKSKRSVKRL
jgi:hypothetical protein